MVTALALVDTRLEELAYLTARHHGDPRLLDDATGFSNFFTSDDVIAVGRQIHEDRAAVAGGSAAVSVQLFQSVGVALARSAAVFTAAGDAFPAVRFIYFTGAESVVEVVHLHTRTLVALHPSADVHPLLARHLPRAGHICVYGRFTHGAGPEHLAVSDRGLAVSDDGKIWRATDLEATTPAEALQRYVSR